MISLPHPTAPLAFTGQPDSGGHARTDGQPDVGHTAGGAPVLVFNYAAWASLYLVTVHHNGERRFTWVYGSPARLVDFARSIGLTVEVTRRAALDETLPAFVGWH